MWFFATKLISCMYWGIFNTRTTYNLKMFLPHSVNILSALSKMFLHCSVMLIFCICIKVHHNVKELPYSRHIQLWLSYHCSEIKSIDFVMGHIFCIKMKAAFWCCKWIEFHLAFAKGKFFCPLNYIWFMLLIDCTKDATCTAVSQNNS